MPTHYLFGTVLTGQAVAANNRGDNIGNTTTLQKVFINDDLHTSVSAEAIRFAIRYRFQLEGARVNRTYDGAAGRLAYADEKRTTWNPTSDNFVDDDIMGFMDAAAAAVEQEDEEEVPSQAESQSAKKKMAPKAKGKAKGTTTKRPSPLAIGRAVSLRPYRGEISFNAVSGEKTKGKLSLYNAEMHTTEYQYSFGLNLADVVTKRNIAHVIDAIIDPPQVAGNHARFAYDFSPASIVFRVTSAHSSRIQNCFEHDELSRGITARELIARVKAKDIPANELFVGGAITRTTDGQDSADGTCLASLGATVTLGVREAARLAMRRIAGLSNDYAVVDPEPRT